MSEYIFLNPHFVPFCDMSGDHMRLVVDGLQQLADSYEIQFYCKDVESWVAGSFDGDLFDGVFRIKDKPYTLEDALKEIAKDRSSVCTGGSSGVYEYMIRCDNAMNIIRKLAKSLGGES